MRLIQFVFKILHHSALMAIYWNTRSLPALRDLTDQECAAAIKSAAPKVFRRWQVWLPILAQFVTAMCFVHLVPPFPYKMFALVGGAYITIKLAFVPYHHFLNLEVQALGQNKAAASGN